MRAYLPSLRLAVLIAAVVAVATLTTQVWHTGVSLEYHDALATWKSTVANAKDFTPHRGVITGISDAYYDDSNTLVYDVTVSGGGPAVQSPVPDFVKYPLNQGQHVTYWTYNGTAGGSPTGYDLFISGQPVQTDWLMDAYSPPVQRPWDGFTDQKSFIGDRDLMGLDGMFLQYFWEALFTKLFGWLLWGALALATVALIIIRNYIQKRPALTAVQDRDSRQAA